MASRIYPKDLGPSKHYPVILDVPFGIATKFGSTGTKSEMLSFVVIGDEERPQDQSPAGTIWD